MAERVTWQLDVTGNAKQRLGALEGRVGSLGAAVSANPVGAMAGGLTAVAGAAAATTGAVIAAAAAFKLLADDVTGTVDRLNTFAVGAGFAIETVEAMEIAAGAAGKALTDFFPKDFAKRMADAQRGTGEALVGFQALGVSVTDASGNLRSADAVFRDTIDGLAGVDDATTKAAISTQIFGRRGLDMLTAFSDSSHLDAFVALAEEFGTDTGPAAVKATGDWIAANNELKIALDEVKSSLFLAFSSDATEAVRTLGEMLIRVAASAELLRDVTVAALKGIEDAVRTTFPLLLTTLDLVGLATAKAVGETEAWDKATVRVEEYRRALDRVAAASGSTFDFAGDNAGGGGSAGFFAPIGAPLGSTGAGAPPPLLPLRRTGRTGGGGTDPVASLADLLRLAGADGVDTTSRQAARQERQEQARKEARERKELRDKIDRLVGATEDSARTNLIGLESLGNAVVGMVGGALTGAGGQFSRTGAQLGGMFGPLGAVFGAGVGLVIDKVVPLIETFAEGGEDRRARRAMGQRTINGVGPEARRAAQRGGRGVFARGGSLDDFTEDELRALQSMIDRGASNREIRRASRQFASNMSGDPFIQRDGLRFLHRGERVVTPEQNMNFNQSFGGITVQGGGDPRAIAEALRRELGAFGMNLAPLSPITGV